MNMFIIMITMVIIMIIINIMVIDARIAQFPPLLNIGLKLMLI